MHNNKYLKENPNPNPNPNQPLLAYHFIQALTRINLAAHTASTKQRSHIIKHAAYVSMAFAAGNKRTWTHAVLHNRFPIKTRFHRLSGGRRSFNVSLSRNKETHHHAHLLRSLVPGGHAMEFSSLLMETANYIQYLTAQVRLMQCIVEKFDMHV